MGWAKHGLRFGDKTTFGLPSETFFPQIGEQLVERETEEKKRRKEERRKEGKKGKEICMDTCFGLYGTTLDVRISCLAFDLSKVLLGISLLTLDLMRVGLGKN